jgi:very-short-patch-repair endonuclease
MTRARQPWKGTTQHERLLWRHLRNRQHPVDRYMVDFTALKPASRLNATVVGHKFPNREALDQETDAFSCQQKYSGSAILELSDQPGTEKYS